MVDKSQDLTNNQSVDDAVRSPESGKAAQRGTGNDSSQSLKAGNYLALAVATCGVGYIPLAPGTWGSLVGVGLYLALRRIAVAFEGEGFDVVQLTERFATFQLVTIVAVTLAGIWAASRAETIFQQKDSGKIVIDEVAGQLIALLPLPLLSLGPRRLWIVAAFLLFRAFDITKPYPIRRLEGLSSGLGVMADDLAAGAYAAVVTSALVAVTIR